MGRILKTLLISMDAIQSMRESLNKSSGLPDALRALTDFLKDFYDLE